MVNFIAIIIIAFLALTGASEAQTWEYLPGDVNMYNGAWPPSIIGADVTYLVNYFRGERTSNPCLFNYFWAAADVNGDCTVIGSDVTRLVSYFRGAMDVDFCNDVPPAWPIPEDLPYIEPAEWPDCSSMEDYPPEFEPIEPRQVNEGEHLGMVIFASDPEGDEISLTAELLPENASFADSGDGRGALLFDPEFEQADIYQVRFIALANGLADTEMVQITVADVNRSPVLDPIGSKTVYVNNLLEFETSASDPDGTIPEITAINLPTEAIYIDNGNGQGSFSWTPDPGDTGSHQVSFIASDGMLADSEMVVITVLDSTSTQGLIVDHTFTAQWQNIPDPVIAQILDDNRIYYAHTSHGGQINSGSTEVNEADSRFPDINYYPYQIIHNVGDDLGHNGDTSWAAPTRSYLDSHPECTIVMYSWCFGVSDNTEQGINIYLNKITELESQYPDRIFIYMTGHLDGTGPDGNLYQRNNQIRQYCTANDKILYDFADIESWDPDGNYYPDDSDACHWCSDWCDDPDHDCDLDCYCAHSHCFNCLQKSKAWWVMMARLEGWTGN
ncbi:MAG: hypothetical protein GY839_21740 [candidate division Zixibacteria bacterium]|nr:hypothetical protein [candidate division Zixibacteria bacterium]